ncbi:hypothetical protein [Erwinia phage vB_Ea277G]|nr:hypothetical protein [Erwinia phage vB_Ea277G]
MSNLPEDTPPLPAGLRPLPDTAFQDDDAVVEVVSQQPEIAPVVAEPAPQQVDPATDIQPVPEATAEAAVTATDLPNDSTEADDDAPVEQAQEVSEVGFFFDDDKVEGKVDLSRSPLKDASNKANFSANLSLLRTTLEDYYLRGESMGDMAGLDDYNWFLAMRDAIDSSLSGKGLTEAVVRDQAHWVNEIATGKKGRELRLRKTLFKRPEGQKNGQALVGSRATEAFVTGTGIGHPVQVPLWRTGIWVTMRTPSIGYLAEIDRALAFARPELGMDTSGMLNSNEALLFEEILVDAALRLVTSTSYPIASSPLELKEVISAHDKDQLIWGMAVAAWPDGTDIAIPCTDGECRHTDRVFASLLRMSWVDEGRLTTAQRTHMDRAGTGRVTDEDLEKYQADFLTHENEYFEYKSRRFNFFVSTLAEYFANGRQWINSVNRALVEAMGEDLEGNDQKRAALINSLISSEQLCRYGHYIRNIEIPNPEDEDSPDTIDGEDEIRDILKLLSAEPATVNELLRAVDNYIQNSMVSLIASINVPCSACGKLHLNRGGEARLILPFNAALGFFTLAQRKMVHAGIQPLTDLSTLGIRNFVQQVSANASMASSSLPVA